MTSHNWGLIGCNSIATNQSQAEMFYLNTIKQLFLSVEQLELDQLEVCLPFTGALPYTNTGAGARSIITTENL